MNRICNAHLLALTMLFMIIPGSAVLAWTGDSLDLSKAVPADAYIYVHGRKNPDREMINELWTPFFEALSEAELHKDVLEMISSAVPPEDAMEMDGIIDQLVTWYEAVDWVSLVSEEVVYTSRMRLPVAEYLVYFRCTPEKAEQNYKGLKGILDQLATMIHGFTIEDVVMHGVTVHKVTFGKREAQSDLCLARMDDVIVVFIGRELLKDSLEMLITESEIPRMIDSEVYKKATKILPPAEDVFTIFRPGGMMDAFSDLFAGKIGEEIEKDPEAKRAISAIMKIMGMLDFFECIATVETTDRDRIYTYEAVLTKPGFAESPIGKIMQCQKPIDKYDRFVPKDAISFSTGSMVDFKAIYSLAVDFFKTEIPDGDKYLAKWQAIQEQFGFNIEKDLLDWLGHSYVNITLPAARPSAMGGNPSVSLLEVKDPEAAQALITRAIAMLNGFLESMNQALIIRDVEIEGTTGFQSVTHPFVMALGVKMIIGLHDGYLIIGSSEPAISSCLATARGESPSIAENERFKAEGLKPCENMYALSFTDKSNMAKEIGAVMQGVSMGISMMSVFAASEEPELGRVFSKIGLMLGKVGPIVSEIDFYKSSSSITTVKGDYSLVKSVTNYRLPEKSSEKEKKSSGELIR